MSCQQTDNISLVGAKITSISPETGLIRDQIIIEGENFKSINTNVVIFAGGQVARILYSSTNRLIVEVPDSGVIDGPISVKVSQVEQVFSSQNFILDNSRPVIVSMNPNSGLANKLMTISGANFSTNKNDIVVKFGDKEAEVVSAGERKIVALVPQGLPDGIVNVIVNVKGVQSNTMAFEVGIIFKDNFNRADVKEIDNTIFPNPIGSDWRIIRGKWSILQQEANSIEAGIMFYEADGAILTAGNGKSFKLATDVKLKVGAPTVFGGLIINAQNNNEYYVLRLSGVGAIQFLSTNNGGQSWSVLYNQSYPELIGMNYYHMEVFSDTPGVFALKISNIATANLVVDLTITDPSAKYNGGVGGYWGEENYSLYDNFNIILK